MNDTIYCGLVGLTVVFLQVFAAGFAQAEATLHPVDAYRIVQCSSSVSSGAGNDDGSGEESSMVFGPFAYALSFPVSSGSATALGASVQSSQIDAMGFHADASVQALAEISDLDGFANASTYDEFRLYFTVENTNVLVSYSMSGWFSASERVEGHLSLGDAGTGLVLQSFVGSTDSTAFDYTGLLAPGEEYMLYGYLESSAAADPLGDWSQSGNGSFHFDLTLATAVAAPIGRAETTYLQVWPNPCAGRSQISLVGKPFEGRLAIFDIRGRRVRQFELQPEQRVLSWDGYDQRGKPLPAGVYFLRLAGAGYETQHKLTLLR